MAKEPLQNKIIWITGASSGIGKSLAIALNRQGNKLILSSRNRDLLYQVKENCERNPINVHILDFDINNEEIIKQKTEEALRIFGHMDMVIHCAGVTQRSYAEVTELNVDKSIMQTNFIGPVALTKALLPNMIKRRNGAIVVVSSIVGKFGTPYRSAYAASKHALHGFFDSLRAEVEDRGVKVHLVCPGFVNTNLSINALRVTALNSTKKTTPITMAWILTYLRRK